MNGPFENPDYSRACDRDLCVALSKYIGVKDEGAKKIREIESDAEKARVKGVEFVRATELGHERMRYIHAIRQIVSIKGEQDKRAASNHRSRAIARKGGRK